MIVYIIILLLLLSFWSISTCNKKLFEKPFLWLGIIVLIAFASIRELSVGTDTLGYYDNFINVESQKYTRTFSGSQIIWYYFVLFFSSFFNYTVFLFVCYTLIFGGLGVLINRFSKDQMLSLILIFLFCYGASLNIMRQYIAIGIFASSLIPLYNRNYILYIICIIIASFFHFSVLLMLPLIFIHLLQLKKRTILVATILSFVIGFFFNFMQPIVMSLSFLISLNEGVTGYLDSWGGERNIGTNLLINFVFIASLFIDKHKVNLFWKLWFFYIVLSNLFGASPQGNRIFLYLLIGMFVCIPYTLTSLKFKTNQIVYLLFVLIYSIGYWYVVLSSGQNEVIPYEFRS